MEDVPSQPRGSGESVALSPATREPRAWRVSSAPSSDWQRYATAVRRHKPLVLLLGLAGLVVGLVGTRFLDPRYSVRSILWIEAAGGIDPASPLANEGVVRASGWRELITSNAVLDSVVRRLRLHVRARTATAGGVLDGLQLAERYRPGAYRLEMTRAGKSRLLTADGVVLEEVTAGDSIGKSVGFVWAPRREQGLPNDAVHFEVRAPYDAARELARELRIHLDEGGSFLRLELKGSDPSRAAATLNAVTEGVVAVAAELKRSKYREVAGILSDQYVHAERTLNAAESALRDFRVHTADEALLARGRGSDAAPRVDDPALERAIDVQLALEEARRDRGLIEDVLASSTDSGLRVEALAVLGAVQRSPQLTQALDELTRKRAELRALRNRYTDASEPVTRLRADIEALEAQAIPGLARTLASELKAREVALDRRRSTTLEDLRRVPVLALREARLERDAASSAELFAHVRQRYEATRLALLSSLPDVRVLDAAVGPRRPLTDFGPLLVVLCVVAGLGLGVAGANLRDRTDSRVRYPEQVTQGMQLDILGAVPRAGWSVRTGGSSADVIEALRGLRMRALHAHGTDTPLRLTVTSTLAAEGKSFISVNLALSFASAGFDTLLIDGDVRRGTLHRVLDASRRPGLTDLLAGRAELESTIQRTQYEGISLIAAGTWTQRAPELLMSPQLRALFARLQSRFGAIIVDSPPLAAGTDPLVLATVTENLLLVLRSGMTELPVAEAKLDVIASLPVRIIGVVLNDVRVGDAFRHYTYDLTGYGAPVEEEIPAGRGGPMHILGGRP